MRDGSPRGTGAPVSKERWSRTGIAHPVEDEAGATPEFAGRCPTVAVEGIAGGSLRSHVWWSPHSSTFP